MNTRLIKLEGHIKSARMVNYRFIKTSGSLYNYKLKLQWRARTPLFNYNNRPGSAFLFLR